MSSTPFALMLYPVLAPAEAAQPVITRSVIEGNAIDARPAKVDGWMFLRMKLKPLERFDDPNRSLIVSRLEPKQLGELEGSQGGYLKSIRAHTHTWLQAGGDLELATKRLAEYRAMEAEAVAPGEEWGPPRQPGKQQPITPAIAPSQPGVRGKDKAPRQRRRDEYVAYTSPHGESLMILGSSELGRDLLANGAYVPNGWSCRRVCSESPKDVRSLLKRLGSMKAEGVAEERARTMLEIFLRGDNPSATRTPVTRATNGT
jgi:hypothetical protein